MHAVLFAVCNSCTIVSSPELLLTNSLELCTKQWNDVGSCYFCANAKLGAGSKSFTVFFTALMSMSISFPVADEMTVKLLLSSTCGRNSFAFSADENKATLAKRRKVAEPKVWHCN